MGANITMSILILAISMVIASLIILAVRYWKNKKTQEEQIGEERNNRLSWMVLLIPIVPVLILFVFIEGGNLKFVEENYDVHMSYLNGMNNITATDLSKNKTLEEWIKNCDGQEGEVFAIVSGKSDTCVIYVKGAEGYLKEKTEVTIKKNQSIQKTNLYLTEKENLFGYDFLLYQYDISENVKFKVKVDSEKKDVHVTYTDDDISYNTWREE